jgi:hypothetical protein
MRRNKEVAHSNRGRTIKPTEAAIARGGGTKKLHTPTVEELLDQQRPP